jgi:D-xylose transport system permease protein
MTEKSSIGRIKLRTSALRAYTMLLALIVIWLFFQWATIDANHPYGIFLGAINFSKLLQQTAVTGVIAVGMLMVIVSGNIDLSVGAKSVAGGIAAKTGAGIGSACYQRSPSPDHRSAPGNLSPT